MHVMIRSACLTTQLVETPKEYGDFQYRAYETIRDTIELWAEIDKLNGEPDHNEMMKYVEAFLDQAKAEFMQAREFALACEELPLPIKTLLVSQSDYFVYLLENDQ